jgi:hypothetical protein
MIFFTRSDKRKIYQLIDLLLSHKISESTFCHEFCCSYDLELDYDTLTAEEYKAFSALGEITSRFSEFEEDIKKYPGTYYTKDELKEKIKKQKRL